MKTRARLLLAGSLLSLLSWATLNAFKRPSQWPTVVVAQVPFYPEIPQKAHIDGLVRLHVTTDGKRTLVIDQLSGQPMLLKAAAENVRTWEFAQHTPTGFDVSFRYTLLPSMCHSGCDCYSDEPASVILRLPTEVEIRAPEVKICDPVTTIYDDQ